MLYAFVKEKKVKFGNFFNIKDTFKNPKSKKNQNTNKGFIIQKHLLGFETY